MTDTYAPADYLCPLCNSICEHRVSKTKLPNGAHRRFYFCTNHKCRRRWGAKTDGTPTGLELQPTAAPVLVDARSRAHHAFDRLWLPDREGRRLMSRGTAYRKMREWMELTEDQAHIAVFTIEQCERLIELAGDVKTYSVPKRSAQRSRGTAHRDYKARKLELREAALTDEEDVG